MTLIARAETANPTVGTATATSSVRIFVIVGAIAQPYETVGLSFASDASTDVASLLGAEVAPSRARSRNTT